MNISPKYTSTDWKRLDLSRPADWRKAVRILDDRMNGRFLKAVEAIDKGEYSGFAVLALDCLLIESLQQFREGVDTTPRGKGCIYFERFLTDTLFSSHFDRDTAAMFYDQFRCGILHQAEIKKSSKVWRIGPVVRRTDDGEGLVINRRKFHRELRRAFAAYVKELREGTNSKLKDNFIAKMNHICR